MRRMDEERFHAASVEQHEAGGNVVFIHGEPERGFGQECGDFGFDFLTILRGKKVMRRIHGTAPDLDDTMAVCRRRSANAYHDGASIQRAELPVLRLAWA